jgi:predicted Zn-dependent protease with MMP-like domain
MDDTTRNILQDAYITRIIESMDWNDLAQYAYDKLDEELSELTDEHLIEQVGEYHPDLLEGTENA